MTAFSSVLESYMKEKEIKTYALAQFCGIDRSNMYKLLNGKRNPPSEEIVERIAEYMRLKPLERKYLVEAYYITVMGYDTYYRRKSVQEFFASFTTEDARPEERTEWYESVSVNAQELNLLQGRIIKGRQLHYLISCVLSIEAQKPAGRIELLAQPGSNHIMDILAYVCGRKEDVNIEHIFCLSNTNDIASGKKDYNLYCLEGIFPLFTQCVCNYKPYCYYDNIASHNNSFNLLSSMILTSRYAVVFSAEEQCGILLSEEGTVKHLYDLFQSLKEDAILIARKINSIENQLKAFEKMNFREKGINFQPESCLIPLLPTAFVGKYLNRKITENEQIVEKLFQYLRCLTKKMEESKTTFIFTRNGIQKFAETGRISELPASVYAPLEESDRILLLRKLLAQCETGRYQMLRPEAPVAEADIFVYSSVREGYLLLPLTGGTFIFLEICEAGLLNAFQDYFESLGLKYMYGREEAAQILKELIKEIKICRLSEKQAVYRKKDIFSGASDMISM